MHERKSVSEWLPTLPTLIAALLVIAGILLTSVSWWCVLLIAAGTFGPGILRELGWLRDKDEFQLQANYRASYHAYIAAGVMAFVLLAYFRSSERTIDQPQELATLFLTTLWFTWFLSSLIGYWGATKAASRLLLCFGCVWLFFAIVTNVGNEWTGWTALLLHPLLALPFFALAWLSRRWPKISGGLLLAVSVFFVQFFGMFRRDNIAVVNQAVTFVLFIGPLLASGIALLAARAGDTESEDHDHTPQSEAVHAE